MSTKENNNFEAKPNSTHDILSGISSLSNTNLEQAVVKVQNTRPTPKARNIPLSTHAHTKTAPQQTPNKTTCKPRTHRRPNRICKLVVENPRSYFSWPTQFIHQRPQLINCILLSELPAPSPNSKTNDACFSHMIHRSRP